MIHNPIITQVTANRDTFYSWIGKYEKILTVADDNTAPFASFLENTQLLTLSPTLGSPSLIPDETAIGKIFIAAEGHEVIVAVGSGTICDLVRYVSSRLGIPYFIVATAASMDGYTSAVTAPIVDNVKQTYFVSPPNGVLADPEIYKTAPDNLTAAGFADIIGKFTSVADWEMEGLLYPNLDTFCQQLADEMRNIAKGCFNAKTPESIMEALLNSGLVMQKAGHSKPASGAEHHLSHYWEMKAIAEGTIPALHGAKVGVTTLLVLQATEWLLEEDITHEKIENWQTIKQILSQNLSLRPQVEAAIANLGGPTTPIDLEISREDFINGILHAHSLRDRFTIWVLLDTLGLLSQYAERLANANFN
ncbi:MAG: iron-containing alcohol dehydrogenase [Defluviitaleaceae bacterium]|nr:iron-containing alcohol dehydrogenase [Defluviitaleaceae bacterium]